MTINARSRIRCAIYTRKSSEEGLEQSFNSLHAQREACEAYIASQRHEGWHTVTTKYDDGAFSGGNMERPALQRLLADIAAKKLDTVVVYKVDRLTRSSFCLPPKIVTFSIHRILKLSFENSTPWATQPVAFASREAEESAEQEQVCLFGVSREGDRLLGKAKELEVLVAERTETIAEGTSGKKLHEAREGQIRLIRQKNEGAVRRLSQLFDAVIRELVPGEIEGSVLIDGKGITLKVSQGGERSTAAIDSLKVVTFDIAALLLAVEGAAHLPTFLLHDSPREADLGRSIYDRLFRFIQSLENKAHFQYIVTTTTEPPSDLRREPWLRATLRGGPAQDRLMGCDL